MKRNISVVILNLDGRPMLEECLPSLIAALEHYGGLWEIIIVDNASIDDSVAFLEKNYPHIKVIQMQKNDPLVSLDTGIDASQYEFLSFCNNDMVLEPDCLDYLMPHFDDERVFAVTARVYEWDRTTLQSRRRFPRFSRGFFYYLPVDENAPQHGFTCHATGGQSIVRKSAYRALGGNDHIFKPLYHEDLDLTWRAYKGGWIALYEPRAIVYHRGGATSRRIFSQDFLRMLQNRNFFLFMWKNLHSPAMLGSHLAWLPVRLGVELFKGNKAFLRGFASALRALPALMRSRRAAAAAARLDDPAVFALFED
jgi:GT2 family glycosyltransferase